jgi:hypothetical protein
MASLLCELWVFHAIVHGHPTFHDGHYLVSAFGTSEEQAMERLRDRFSGKITEFKRRHGKVKPPEAGSV